MNEYVEYVQYFYRKNKGPEIKKRTITKPPQKNMTNSHIKQERKKTFKILFLFKVTLKILIVLLFLTFKL